MPIDLTLRSESAGPLTAVENDTNLTDIETAVNNLESDLADVGTDKLDVTDFDAFFEGTSGGKKQVAWTSLTGVPTALSTPCYFLARKTDPDQTIAAPGDISVNLTTEAFDVGGNFASSTFTAPVSGMYQIIASAQVALDSGTPSDISIVASLAVNGSPVEQVTLDNSGTGTRIYKLPAILQLAPGDDVTFYVSFDWTGSATWKVEDNNTSMGGCLLHAL